MIRVFLDFIKILLYGYIIFLSILGIFIFGSGHTIPHETLVYLSSNVVATVLGILILTFWTKKLSLVIASNEEKTQFVQASFNSIIYKLNNKEAFVDEITELIHLGGIDYTSSAYTAVLNAINNRSLGELLDTSEYSVQNNNIEIFYVEGARDEKLFVIIYNPFDAWENEQLLKVMPAYDGFSKHS